MRLLQKATCLAISSFVGFFLLQPAYGQSNSREERVSGGKAAVCMYKPVGDAALGKTPDRDGQFLIFVARKNVEAFKVTGFVRTKCRGTSLAGKKRKQAWRDEICELAGTGNEAVQNQLEKAYGARPAVLCAAAEIAEGQWKRKRKKRGQ